MLSQDRKGGGRGLHEVRGRMRLFTSQGGSLKLQADIFTSSRKHRFDLLDSFVRNDCSGPDLILFLLKEIVFSLNKKSSKLKTHPCLQV